MMTSTAGSRTLYVSDLDRTLLGSDGSVSTESSRLLNAAISDGTLFTYVTAPYAHHRTPASEETARPTPENPVPAPAQRMIFEEFVRDRDRRAWNSRQNPS